MIRQSESIKFLILALDEFHTKTPQVVKDSVNPHFGNKFASGGTIDKAINPYLHEAGLVLTQFPCVMDDGAPGLDSLLAHVSGEWMAAESPLVMDRTNSQGQGSGLTYLRRYATCAILRITADDDDDANKASEAPRRPQEAPRYQAPAQVAQAAEQVSFAAPEPPGDPNLATGKQIGYLTKLLDDAGIGDGAAGQEWLQREVGNPHLKKLTKAQAGQAIDLLK